MRDALPDVAEAESDGEWEGLEDDGAEEVEGQIAAKARRKRKERKLVMTSLKHRPGAMKRRSQMEERERERFGRNLAQMAGNAGGGGGDEGGTAGASQSEKWAALRRFIGGTMVKDDAFGGG